MNDRPYTIAEDGKSITCHTCGRTSYNMNDVANVYCGNCHCFYEVGTSTRRDFVDKLFSIIEPLLGERGCVLIITQPGADSGTLVETVTNLDAPTVRRLFSDLSRSLNPPQ